MTMNPMGSRVPDQQSQFYLHDQPQQTQRRTWSQISQPQPVQNLTHEIAAVGYQQSIDPAYRPQSTGTIN